MKHYLTEYETTNGETKTAVVRCSNIMSLYNNLNKQIPDLRRIIEPTFVNINKEEIIDLTRFE